MKASHLEISVWKICGAFVCVCTLTKNLTQIQICAMQRCGKRKRGLPWQLGCVYLKCESTYFAMWIWPTYTQVSVNAQAHMHTDIHVSCIWNHTCDINKTVIYLSKLSQEVQCGEKCYSGSLYIFLNSDYSYFLLTSSCFLHVWPDDLHLLLPLCTIHMALLDTLTLFISLLF